MVTESWSYASQLEGYKAIYHVPFRIHSLRESFIPCPIVPLATLLLAVRMGVCIRGKFMKSFLSCCSVFAVFISVFVGGHAFAQAAGEANSCREILSQAGSKTRQRSYCEEVLANKRNQLKDWGKDTSGLTTNQVLDLWGKEDGARFLAQPQGIDTMSVADKRVELKQWGVDVSSMSDKQVLDRYNREDNARLLAEYKKGLARTEADMIQRYTEQQKSDDIGAEHKRAAEQLAKQALSGKQGLIDSAAGARTQQADALRSLGVDPDAAMSDDEEASDAAFDKFELKMAQQMIDNGLAPQCKGKKNQELIDCVDRVVNGDE